MRTGTTYKADFFTQVSGSCAVYIYDGSTGSCVYNATQFRGIGSTQIEEIGVAGWTIVHPNPTNYPPQLDTRLSGTSTPDNPAWTFNYEGERTVQFKSNITVTACNLQPNFVLTQMAFKAVKCVPEWLKTWQGALYHNSQTQSPPILVRVPTTMNARMRTGVQRAVDGWNAALNTYGSAVGPRYQYLESNTTCSGPNCINTQIGPVNLETECAFSDLDADASTGLIIGSTITFPPESSNWPQAFNDRLAAHELGHHLGLKENYSSCGAANSLMKPVSCGASIGFPTSPTTSDHLPVARTTYQGQTTSTCQ